jgi:hypothetical protein
VRSSFSSVAPSARLVETVPAPVRCSSCLLHHSGGKPPVPEGLLLPVLSLLCGQLERAEPELPHPECGSRNYRDNSLILVITGVEAGDPGRSRRSEPKRPCWPVVGGQRLPVVDTWTSRRLCTGSPRRPPSVPWLPPRHPQSMPRSLGRRPTGRCGPPRTRRSTGYYGRFGCPAQVTFPSRRGHEISPGCAHSWGQLLDLSTVLTLRNRAITAHHTAEPTRRHVHKAVENGSPIGRVCERGAGGSPSRHICLGSAQLGNGN